ncbi:unnamed protein product [Orchesella dallaii]|uniref:DOPA 4,5-dioxygenase n=1 Tax=Orchesella dallaii TaxID=48710 RepID=A0ABP1R1X8_9HEXA
MNQYFVAVLLAVVATAAAQGFYEEEIGAWHFHTYFFEVNPSKTAEAIAFRKATRQMINGGDLPDCSLNQIYIGWDGPHPVSQWELCCNKTGYAAAHSWHTQNHGNLSVLIHPLTIYDIEDHKSRTSWLGKEVVIDAECPCLYPELPQPRPCPVYPEYSDELPDPENPQYETPIRGTEDYLQLNKDFDILRDTY